MLPHLAQASVVAQALAGTGVTWAFTALGAAAVFVDRQPTQRSQDAMLGFAAGVMLAASYWSLLGPALEMASHLGRLRWLPAVVGFASGAAVLRAADFFLPHAHPESAHSEGLHTTWRRAILLVTAITLHNLPEGLAVGVAFGAAAVGRPEYSLASAWALTVGIAMQNLPEGVAVSVPLRRTGMSAPKSFWYGQLSGLVEPLAGALGALAVSHAQPLLPYALSFAAGAMIFVVIEDAVPEAQCHGHTDIVTLAAAAGFLIMMILDVALA